jgi:diguanylate cyclase (GGDEF)-like protein
MFVSGTPAKATRMTSPVFYILVALALTSAMISVIFFMAWKMLGGKPYALSWAVAFLAATCQWSFNLASGLFPDWETYWIIVNTFSLVVITLGIRGHCQRTNCKSLPQNLWPWAGLVYAGVLWSTIFQPHIGISTAIVPGVGAMTLFGSAAMIVKHREVTRPAEWAAAIVMVLFGITQMAAAVVGLMQGAAGDPVYRDLYLHFNFLTLPAGYTGIAMFVIFMLASDILEEMKDVAVRDQLTGLLNRRGFNEQGARAYSIARRAGHPVSVIMTDIDRFKDINDELGHAAGDNALCHFARILAVGRRAEDVLARVGGEEFAIVLPGTGLESALKIADNLCILIETSPIKVDGNTLPMTASFGVATLSNSDTCLSDVILRADRALYRSKRSGRNRVDLESSQLMLALDGTLRPISG